MTNEELFKRLVWNVYPYVSIVTKHIRIIGVIRIDIRFFNKDMNDKHITHYVDEMMFKDIGCIRHLSEETIKEIRYVFYKGD